MPRDITILFATRTVRLFAYGFLSVVLVLYLALLGIDEVRIGALLTLTLIGDTLISLLLSTRADTIGRKRTLLAGAVLMVGAGSVFATSSIYPLLVIAATLGVISPSGHEVGPFLPIEQVALSQTVEPARRTGLFAWYNLAGSLATAFGALAAGTLVDLLTDRLAFELSAYRAVVLIYALLGVVLFVLFLGLSPAVESSAPTAAPRTLLRVEKSRSIVLGLSALFMLDSFAGGFIVQSIVAWWFHHRFGLPVAAIGAIFFGGNILAGISALVAAKIAGRIGLLNTMVFTHLPSNLLLMCVPFMPSASLAITVLLVRFSISQMDVPTRQSYVIAVVEPSERSAAAGITGVARTTGAALAPLAAMPLISGAAHWAPFVIAGALKIVYDLALLAKFRRVRADNL